MRTPPHLKGHLMLDMQQTSFQDDILIVCFNHLFHPHWPWKCIFVKNKSSITPWRSCLKHRQADGCSLRKQPAFRDTTTGFPAKWRLMNERPQPSMEFLRSFLRRHFAGKRVLASRNVGLIADWSIICLSQDWCCCKLVAWIRVYVLAL